MIDTRVFYSKLGNIRYISHLDMNRLMQRALKRSRLPVWYTQGFNPHMYLTFALPLSLGFESACEIMDIRLCEQLAAQEVKERLGAQMPAGLEILRVAPPQMEVRDIAFCDYAVFLEAPAPQEAARRLAGFLEAPIQVEKKTKRGVKTLDVQPYARLLGLAPAEGGVRFSLRMHSGNEVNINPSLVVGAFCAQEGLDPDGAAYRRTGVFNQKGQPFA